MARARKKLTQSEVISITQWVYDNKAKVQEVTREEFIALIFNSFKINLHPDAAAVLASNLLVRFKPTPETADATLKERLIRLERILEGKINDFQQQLIEFNEILRDHDQDIKRIKISSSIQEAIA